MVNTIYKLSEDDADTPKHVAAFVIQFCTIYIYMCVCVCAFVGTHNKY